MSWNETIFLGLGLADIIGLICVIGTVWGIKMMSSPATAVSGNLLGAASMAGAIIVTLVSNDIVGIDVVWVAMAVGAALGCFMAVKIAMIEMPQMVALLNGFGGGSSAIVSLMTLVATMWTTGMVALGGFEKVTAVLGLIVGGVTFSGSLIAAGKLSGKVNQRPIILEKQSVVNNLALIVTLILGISAVVSDGAAMVMNAVLVLIGSLVYGVLFTIKVGGADMPITVSLLNSFSGVAASISGFAIGNPLLIAIGAVVGASGLILTQIMCRAMNRTLGQVLSGRTTVLHPAKSQEAVADSTESRKCTQPDGTVEPVLLATEKAAPMEEPEYIRLTRSAKRVIVVPGYGMALAQAQGDVKALMDLLEAGGAEVRVAVHPVAGRMPGHMNVLLAEVDVPYDKLCEMDEINCEFAETDLVIVVGANDVINPAANTAEGTPIYGMPILNAHEAEHVIIFNYDTKPGYAGVDNPLYEPDDKVTLLLGDAAKTVREFMTALGTTV